MFSERRNDGIERSREQWFRRANRASRARRRAEEPNVPWTRLGRAGARALGELTNEALERAGRPERVDHRSYERQGLDREPGEHYGPAAAHMVARGREHDRLENGRQAGRGGATIG